MNERLQASQAQQFQCLLFMAVGHHEIKEPGLLLLEKPGQIHGCHDIAQRIVGIGVLNVVDCGQLVQPEGDASIRINRPFNALRS